MARTDFRAALQAGPLSPPAASARQRGEAEGTRKHCRQHFDNSRLLGRRIGGFGLLGVGFWLLVLSALPGAGLAQTGAPAPTPSSAAAASPQSPASAGLANDWLREQASALNAWDFGGEVRGRYEDKENAGDGSSSSVDFMKAPPPGQFNDNNYFLVRTRVHLGFTPVNWFTAYVGGRDAYSGGDRRNPPKTEDRYDLEQAWLKLGDPKVFPLTAKVGRQDLVYGDERMVGRSDWNNLGWRVFDAALLRFEKPVGWVDAFVGRPVMMDPDHLNEVNHDDWLSGGYASTKSLFPFQESQCYFLAHNVGRQSGGTHPNWLNKPSTPQDTYTMGLRFKSLPNQLKGWDYSFETAGQLGDVQVDGQRLDQVAFAVMFRGGYTWKKTWCSPRLGIGYDFFSGDDNPQDGHNGTFEPLFPTNHRPLGLMDLVGPKNIHDPYAALSFQPAKSVTVALEWHSFWLANAADYFYSDSGSARNSNGYGRHPQWDSYAGSELDVDASWAIKSWAVLRAGYGHYFVGSYVKDSLAATGGARDADWFYAQFTLSF